MTIYTRTNISLEKFSDAIGLVLDRLDQIETLVSGRKQERENIKPISSRDLCEFLDITEPTLYRYRKQGRIPFLTIGTAIRFELPKVLEALESGRKFGSDAKPASHSPKKTKK